MKSIKKNEQDNIKNLVQLAYANENWAGIPNTYKLMIIHNDCDLINRSKIPLSKNEGIYVQDFQTGKVCMVNVTFLFRFLFIMKQIRL